MRLKIPFLLSSLNNDILWSWLFLPVWYILGIDQFVWPFLGLLISFKWFLTKIKNRNVLFFPNNFFLNIFLIFLVLYLLSGIFIPETDQKPYLFFRDLGLYFCAYIFSGVIITRFSFEDIQRIFLIFVAIGLLSVSIMLLSIFGIINYDYYGIVGSFFPQSFKNNDYFLAMIHKTPFELGEYEKVYLFNNFEMKRPRSIFMDATSFGGLLAIVIPISLWLGNIKRRINQKLIFYLVSVLLFISLLFTLTRSAILGLVVAIFLVFITTKGNLLKRGVFLLVTVPLILFICYSLNIHQLIIGRFGSSSDITRLIVYRETFKEIIHFPVFGHGTVMAFPGNPFLPPLGSHSTPLRIAFTQGFLGLALFYSMIFYAIYSLQQMRHIRQKGNFFVIMLTAFLTVMIQSLFFEWLFDAVYFMVVWVLLSVIVRGTLLLRRGSSSVQI